MDQPIEEQVTLPALIGYPDQIAWAERIRARAIAEYELPAALLKVNHARVWIERRREFGFK